MPWEVHPDLQVKWHLKIHKKYAGVTPINFREKYFQ
jgi:hypothetical protein